MALWRVTSRGPVRLKSGRVNTRLISVLSSLSCLLPLFCRAWTGRDLNLRMHIQDTNVLNPARITQRGEEQGKWMASEWRWSGRKTEASRNPFKGTDLGKILIEVGIPALLKNHGNCVMRWKFQAQTFSFSIYWQAMERGFEREKVQGAGHCRRVEGLEAINFAKMGA